MKNENSLGGCDGDGLGSGHGDGDGNIEMDGVGRGYYAHGDGNIEMDGIGRGRARGEGDRNCFGLG